METDQALLAGFIAGDAAAEAALFLVLTRVLWATLLRYFRRHKEKFDDLRNEAFVVLRSWRDDELLSADEPLPHLARRLLRQLLQTEERRVTLMAKHIQEKEAEPNDRPDDFAESVDASRLWEKLATLVDGLSPESRETFIAARAAALNLGPDVPDALKTDRALARARLHRWKIALLPRAVAAGLLRKTKDERWVVADGN